MRRNLGDTVRDASYSFPYWIGPGSPVAIGITVFFILAVHLATANAERAAPEANNYRVLRVIVNVTRVTPPHVDSPRLGAYEADIGLLVSSRYICDTAVPFRLQAYDSSFFDIRGTPYGATFFLLQLDGATCTLSDTEQQYRLLTRWTRRADLRWVLIVPGYVGGVHRAALFPMFVRHVTKDAVVDAQAAGELKGYSQTPIRSNVFSLINNPKILSIDEFSINDDHSALRLVMSLQFGNFCLAEGSMGLETERWVSPDDDTTYIWANLRYQDQLPGCPEISMPVRKQATFSIANGTPASDVVILVPNYHHGTELPVYIGRLKIR